ncbi:MAG: sodium-translocating pyrophosphatase, partial [Hydrogenophilales bacterium CG17_big_fil_post_rev_8_21_14_2_50_63_12]
MNEGLMFALVAAVLALLYGIMSIKWIVSLPTGNDRMREIAAAVQEGAQAYLNRQYTTIGIVGVILLAAIYAALGWQTAVGF